MGDNVTHSQPWADRRLFLKEPKSVRTVREEDGKQNIKVIESRSTLTCTE